MCPASCRVQCCPRPEGQEAQGHARPASLRQTWPFEAPKHQPLDPEGRVGPHLGPIGLASTTWLDEVGGPARGGRSSPREQGNSICVCDRLRPPAGPRRPSLWSVHVPHHGYRHPNEETSPIFDLLELQQKVKHENLSGSRGLDVAVLTPPVKRQLGPDEGRLRAATKPHPPRRPTVTDDQPTQLTISTRGPRQGSL